MAEGEQARRCLPCVCPSIVSDRPLWMTSDEEERRKGMEQKNLEELYHKGELEWEEGEYTVCRGFQWTPP